MRSRLFERGFTLTEVMMTLAIATILLGLAAPNMQDMVRNAQLVGTHNTVLTALQLARSEAIKQSINVAVCARETNTTCGTDWKKGLLVFADTGTTAGTRDSTETILAIRPPVPLPVSLTNIARVAGGSGSISARPFIRFNQIGRSNWRGGGTFIACDGRGDSSIHALNIVMSGDIRNARQNINAFGTSATCPNT